MTRQFVACTFTDGGRPYTYHWDGDEPLLVGEKVSVETKNGEATITVSQIVTEEPPYATKPIKDRALAEIEEIEVPA